MLQNTIAHWSVFFFYLELLGHSASISCVDKDLAHVWNQEERVGNTAQSSAPDIGGFAVQSIFGQQFDALTKEKKIAQ